MAHFPVKLLFQLVMILNQSRSLLVISTTTIDWILSSPIFGNGNVGIFLGYGDGTFASQVTFQLALALTHIRSLLVILTTTVDWILSSQCYEFASVGVFLGYGNGTFSSQTTYSTRRGSTPYDVVVGDLNNDGRLDIVVALYDGVWYYCFSWKWQWHIFSSVDLFNR